MVAILEGPLGVVLTFVVGACVGSFLNVVIHRAPREGLSVLSPRRSFCPSCHAAVAPSDNIPLLSWMLLRGRCRRCNSSIGVRYPAVELVTALLFVMAWIVVHPSDGAGLVHLVAVWYLVSACVAVTVIDFEHTIIPDSITISGIVLGLIASTVFPSLHVGHVGFKAAAPNASGLLAAGMGLLAGGGSLALVGLLGNVMLRRKLEAAGLPDAMGWGDVKWMAMAGTFLGFSSVLSAILLGCFVGALAGVVLIVVARVRGHDAPVGVPFGPFHALGILAELVTPGLAWQLLLPLGTAAT